MCRTLLGSFSSIGNNKHIVQASWDTVKYEAHSSTIGSFCNKDLRASQLCAAKDTRF